MSNMTAEAIARAEPAAVAPAGKSEASVTIKPNAGPVECTIGHVMSVSGSNVTGVIHEKGTNGENLASAAQIGRVLKIGTPNSMVFGIVSGLRITDPTVQGGGGELKIVDIELLGEAVVRDASGAFTFQRGVSIYPALGETILTTTPAELGYIYAPPSTSNLQVGTLCQDPQLPAYLMTDELLGKHFAVLGTTGAGKSCAVALILRAILSKHPNGHIVLLDPHNEYANAFGDMAEMLNTDNLQLPFWILDFEEICGVLIGRDQPDAEIQAEILGRAIVEAKRKFTEGAATGRLTVDTPVPYNLSELIKILEAGAGKLDKPEGTLPYLRLKSRIEALKNDQRFSFMFSGLVVRDNLPDIVSTILRLPVTGKSMTILDMSGVPSEVVEIVVSVMCRMIFDFSLWSTPEQRVPVLLVCEEAHRYVPRADNAGFEPTKRVISRIAKEGRKYGVSLCLVTQRPSELSTSILSQCNTLFALRMSNDHDQEFVRRALPESGHGMLSALPSLHTQEAVAVGEGVTVPMRLRFSDLDETQRPRSGNAEFSTAWQNDIMPQDAIAHIIERWRTQAR